MRFESLARVVLSVAIFCSFGLAQSVATGAPPFSTMQTIPEGQIDLANLNVHIVIPIVHKAGVGIPFDYALSYDSAIWSAPPSGAWQPSPNWGWRAVTEAVTGYVTYVRGTGSCMGDLHMITYPEYRSWQYHDRFGVAHSFGTLVATDTDRCTTSDYPPFEDVESASDGSGYTLDATAGPGVVSLKAANGASISAPLESGSGAGSVMDPNGNTISVNVSGAFTDTLAQTALSVSGSQTANGSMILTYTQASGSPASVTVHYGSYAVATDYPGCSAPGYSTGSAPLVSEIDLPDGTNYQFSYYADGRIQSLKLPTGGTIAYSYSGGSSGILCDGSAATLTRTTPDGTWTYQHTESGSAWTTLVTDPLGNQTNYQFQGIYQTERDAYQGAVGGTLLETDYTCYNAAAAPCNGTAVSSLISERTITTAEGGLQRKADVTYANNLPLVTSVYDWGSGAPGPLLRKTTITYAPLGAITDHPATIEVDDGGGAKRAYTSLGYSGQGNLTSVSRWISGTTNLTTSFTVNGNGTVATATDANGAVTSYAYAGSSCNGAFPTTVSLPGNLSTSAAWNCYVALPASRTDANGQTTSFGYNDPFARLTSISNPDGGGTTISYPDALHAIATTKIDGARNLVTEVVKDSLGRPIYRQTQNGANCDTVETVYDADGRPARVSNPYATACGTPSAGSQFTVTSFDALGRVASVKAVDGSTTTTNYSGNAWQVTDPRGVSRVYQSDGLGQLAAVCEASGQTGSSACGLNIGANGFLTTYSRNALGEITQVHQGAQTRSFNFDGLGRLTSETNPESGTTTYTFDSVADGTCPGGSSSSAGDLVLTTDAAGGKVCLKYDALHRLTDRRLSNGDDYTYAWDGSAANHSLGRLASATAPATTDTFVYDSMGRPTSVTENPADLHGAGWTTGYTYNYLGEPTLVASPSGLRTLRYTFDTEGRATALQDNGNSYYFVGSRTFNAASQLTGQQFVPTQNWLQESIAYNSDGQPWQIDYLAFGGNEVKLQYQWGAMIDASGNVTSNDNDGTLRKLIDATNANWTLTYGHDDLNRVSSAASADNAINVAESFDQYGNRDNQSGTLNESFGASTATNQINGFTFDAAGRLRAGSFGAAGSRGFAWDPAGQMTSYSDGSQSLAFKYDPFGRRIEAIPGSGSPYYYFYGAGDGGHPVAEYNASGGWRTDFLLDGANVGQILDSNGSLYMWATDALGNAVESLQYGSLQISRLYPFGEEGQATSAEYKWTNQIRDGNGLDHFAFRTYSSNLARWLSPDPAGLAAANPANPQSWNRYAYVEDQPLSAVDPLGLDCDPGTGRAIPGTGGCAQAPATVVTVSAPNPPDIPTVQAPLAGFGEDAAFELAGPPGMNQGKWKPKCDCKDDRPQPDPGHPSLGVALRSIAWSGSVGLPIPQTLGMLGVILPFSFEPASNTACLGVGLSVGTPAKMLFSFGPLLFGDLNHQADVLKGGSLTLTVQPLPVLGAQASASWPSGTTVGGPTIGVPGASLSYSHSWCKAF